MDRINGDMELLLNPHHDTLSPDSPPPEYQIEPFTELQPRKPELDPPPPKPEEPAEPHVRWLDRLIPGRKQRLLDAWQEAMKLWKTADAQWQKQLETHNEAQTTIILSYEYACHPAIKLIGSRVITPLS